MGGGGDPCHGRWISFGRFRCTHSSLTLDPDSFSIFSGNKLKSRPTKGKKPAAHFEADPFTTNALLWSKYMDNTVNQGKLSLRDNKIYIPSNGSYYIYTQASYHGKDCSKVGFDYLSHVVLHHFDEATPDRSLLSSQKTLCGGQSGNTSMPANSWRKSLFQGGIFELNKGDYIYTFTRGEDYLAREPGDTYIGLYAL
uniref:Tumor necrosis factor n=1 Tax=Leptobrachium leishanense TaxID=445787 RepID=A0A8C5MJE4_9ANUR